MSKSNIDFPQLNADVSGKTIARVDSGAYDGDERRFASSMLRIIFTDGTEMAVASDGEPLYADAAAQAAPAEASS